MDFCRKRERHETDYSMIADRGVAEAFSGCGSAGHDPIRRKSRDDYRRVGTEDHSCTHALDKTNDQQQRK